MQANSRGRSSGVRYAYRPTEEDEEVNRPQQREEEADSDDRLAVVAAAQIQPAASNPSWFDQVNQNTLQSVINGLSKVRSSPAAVAGLAAGLVVPAVTAALIVSLRKRSLSSTRSSSQRKLGTKAIAEAAANGMAAAAKGSKGSKASKGGKQKNSKAALSPPGPNSKVKPTASCVPLADGSSVIVRRAIAADNSCLFNAVGYTMHQSTNRAPFLRQVVSREVSSDPQVWLSASWLHVKFQMCQSGSVCAAGCNLIVNTDGATWLRCVN
eukprot:GHRR01018177.1.p1 GENE.GHRR01018177.1~~GHRR01018177.1.p1  ORF type:complete len:268 (+),score=87.16 GHRR01018177.1:173-976(+)